MVKAQLHVPRKLWRGQGVAPEEAPPRIVKDWPVHLCPQPALR